MAPPRSGSALARTLRHHARQRRLELVGDGLFRWREGGGVPTSVNDPGGSPYVNISRVDAGRLVVDFVAPEELTTDSQEVVVSLDAGDDEDRLTLLLDEASGEVQVAPVVGDTPGTALTVGSYTLGARHKVALAWSEGELSAALDGAEAATSTPTVPTSLARLLLGHREGGDAFQGVLGTVGPLLLGKPDDDLLSSLSRW